MISPFVPAAFPVMPDIGGVRLAACEAGVRRSGRKDLMLAIFDQDTVVGGVLTTSRTAAAPVEWCRRLLPASDVRALVVNSGNANAFTGMRGEEAVEATVETAAGVIGCTPQDVLVASTGVIGEPLEPAIFTRYLASLARAVKPGSWEDAARAIMTTDTFPKLATVETEIDGVPVVINGFAKGAGMIAPDMATMLGFFFTDAPLSADVAQTLCARAVDRSFNAITVDGDTSTNDTVLLVATGAAREKGLEEITEPGDTRLDAFAEALGGVMRELAHQIVKDGEGASKFVTVHVSGAETEQAARRIALSIANSPLVKTAIAGEDPNWGRIVMAVGKSGEAADRDRLTIWFGDMRVASEGEVDPTYHEPNAASYMKGAEIEIRVDVGVGTGQFTVWTCDFTAEYISINADYRS